MKDGNNDQLFRKNFSKLKKIFQYIRILVHSSISNISKTIDKVKLKDSVLCIV